MIFGDRDRVRSAFVSHETQIVLHAAAYKHVPVMEYNCAEAVLNNVFGTRTVAEAALETAAERFLMVSTDKAVNPSSMMGASKRMAELLVQHLAGDQNNGSVTRCACVRFGNVLGSAGSVVPTFLQQIASGGLSEKCSEFGEPQAFASEEYLPPVSRSQASPCCARRPLDPELQIKNTVKKFHLLFIAWRGKMCAFGLSCDYDIASTAVG